ncbi:terminase small subunit [Deinococcus sp. A31D244]|uniref:terminase small subunit n=1 Tax=Deinococcus sp. A31D244 TaxID=3397675 RepID=UPI0039DF6A2C
MTQTNSTKSTAEELGAALTAKQKRFADAYLGPCRLNASAAAREAKYSDHREGWGLLRHAGVKAYIAARLEEQDDVMSRSEVAARLTLEARSVVDMDAFVQVAPTERTFWVPAREHEPVRELAKKKGCHVDDLDLYDLCGHFGEDQISRTGDGEMLVRVATISQDVEIDWAAAKAAGAISGMAVLKKNRDGSIEYRVKDTSKALEMLGRLHNMFTDKVQVSGADGGPVQVQITRRIVGGTP